MALLNLLSIARTALSTHQRAIDVTGHNVANATTDGYTRQRVDLQPETPLRTPYGMLGRGVRLEDIARQRDVFLDYRFRLETSMQGRHDALAEQLAQVEAVFGDLGGDGLASILDAFWSSWEDLANDPSGASARVLVQVNGRHLTETLHTMDARLAEGSKIARDRLNDEMSILNGLAAEIAELNDNIARTEASGRQANDLRDRRDQAVDQLSRFVPVRTIEDATGKQTILIDDLLLVEGIDAFTLTAVTTSTGRLRLTTTGTHSAELEAGSLSAYLTLINDQIPETRAELNTLAQAIVSEVNTLHRTGVNGQGGTNNDFFDPNGVTASGIELSAAVTLSIDAIAPGSTGAPGDGSVALAIGGLRNASVGILGGVSMNERYTEIVARLGGELRSAGALAEAQGVLVSNIESQRDGVHAVSVDEEMVALISHQQAYAAAARLVTVGDEMIRELLGMVG